MAVTEIGQVFEYEVYLKMAQNCCERDRVTCLDMHSDFKMAQNFKIGNLTTVKF